MLVLLVLRVLLLLWLLLLLSLSELSLLFSTVIRTGRRAKRSVILVGQRWSIYRRQVKSVRESGGGVYAWRGVGRRVVRKVTSAGKLVAIRAMLGMVPRRGRRARVA